MERIYLVIDRYAAGLEIMKSNTIFLSALLFLFTAIQSFAQQNALNPKSTVFIKVTCIDESNGDRVYSLSSGVIVSDEGHILTAGHAFDCVFTDSNGDKVQHKFRMNKAREDVEVRIGNPDAEIRRIKFLEIESSEYHDMAILQFRATPNNLKPAQVCRKTDIAPSEKLLGHGYPDGKNYQPVQILAGGGSDTFSMWNVSAGFHLGMSGGAVTLERSNYVVGLIRGAVPGSTARSQVYPLYRASSSLKDAGFPILESCVETTIIPQDDEEGGRSIDDDIIVTGASIRPKGYFYGHVVDLSLLPNNRTAVRDDVDCDGLSWVVERDSEVVLTRSAKAELSYKYYRKEPGNYAIHLQCHIEGSYRRVSKYLVYTID